MLCRVDYVMWEKAKLPWLHTGTLGISDTLILFLSFFPPFFFFLLSFLLFSLSFSRVGNWGLEGTRCAWQVLTPNQSLSNLSLKPLPCLFKCLKFPLKKSPKHVVLKSLGATLLVDRHPLAEFTDCCCFSQGVDTNCKFTQDKSDNDECVNSGPDTGQTVSCLISFFLHKKNVRFVFLFPLYRWGKLDSEVKIFVSTNILGYRWSPYNKETLKYNVLNTVEI